MKKSALIIIGIIFVIGILLVVGFLLWKKNSPSLEPMIITIKDFSFIPETFVIKIEDSVTVTWKNEDSTIHDITIDNGLFDKEINPGENYSFVFTQKGTYNYHCDIHPSMKGKLIIE